MQVDSTVRPWGGWTRSTNENQVTEGRLMKSNPLGWTLMKSTTTICHPFLPNVLAVFSTVKMDLDQNLPRNPISRISPPRPPMQLYAASAPS